MTARENEIRALLGKVHVETLADGILASEMTVADVRRLLVWLTAVFDQISDGVPPDWHYLDPFPAAVAAETRALIADRMLDWFPEHRGGPN